MCPAFASGRMDKDWHAAERRQRSYRMSSFRTDARYDRDNKCNVVQSDKWESSSHRATNVEDRELHCKVRQKNYCNDDSDRKARTDRSRSPVDYRRKEYVCGKIFPSSDSHLRQNVRNDSITRRHRADSYVSRERSPYKDRSSHSSTLSTCTRTAQPTEQDRYVDIGARNTTEPEGHRYRKFSCSADEKEARWSRYSYTDAPSSGDRRTSRARTSSRHSDELITSDSSPTGRLYSGSKRRGHAELYQDIQCARHGYHDHEDNCKASCTLYSCRCQNSSDQKQTRTSVSDQHDDRMSRHSVSSPAHIKNRLNTKTYQDDDPKKSTGDRRKSSPCDRYSVMQAETANMKKRRSYSDGRPSAGGDNHHQTERRNNTDRTNDASAFEKSCSRDEKPSEKYHETLPSYIGVHKSGCVLGEHASDDYVSLDSKEDLSSFRTNVHLFSQTNESVVMRATDADNKQHFAGSNCPVIGGRTDTASSSLECHVVPSWSAAHRCVFQQSLAQPVIYSNQQWVANSAPAAGIQLLRQQWHGSAVMSHQVSTGNTGLYDLVPTAAVSQLPLLSTKISAVPTNIDPRKLGISAVSLNSNTNVSTLPTNASFNLAAMQPAVGGNIGQHIIDNVYGDSPLLDEPSYNSPVAIHNSSLNLVGSSVSSTDYVRPELIHPVDDLELKKMLDVVTVAKTSLEQTLPHGCHSDPHSLKQQKVMYNFFTFLLFICSLICVSVLLIRHCWLITELFDLSNPGP